MDQYSYDKDIIKETLTIDQVFDLLKEFHAEPYIKNDTIICKTICHHPVEELGEAGFKLYYYDNTHLFRCYTGCENPVFDIFELVLKIKIRDNNSYQLPQAIEYVANYFGFTEKVVDDIPIMTLKDWNILKKYDRINNIDKESKIVEIAEYDGDFLRNYPKPLIKPWLDEGITKDVMDYYEICYNPKSSGIVIPHRDMDGRLIGIRERTLIKENEEKYGKYMPMRANGKMYNHPLSFSLYGLYQNKNNISSSKRVFVFEAEKSVLKYGAIFGQENNIAVACCGSSFIQYQAWLLLNLGVEEIIIGLDKQYQELGDNEHKKLVRNLKQIHQKYGYYTKISYLFDKEQVLGYKDSPIDCGKDAFMELYKKRVNLY